MSIKIVQTCNKCKKDRELRASSAGSGGEKRFFTQEGGWRPFGEKDVCPECINAFIQEMG